ncbi:putative Alpha/beta hydrolase fold-3 domain-containing protein [Seiridium cardinale]|uniref:Alpha/beta hydrolase fold-3 domain-containing protein n=1 Tax=Seiridium cardinale TaxID=138064 RepID=A0ABR2XI14_9PEZI
MQDFSSLILPAPPPLDLAWLAHEEFAGLRKPKPVMAVVERQPIYASECRARNAAMMAPGARDHYLSQGIHVETLTVPSRRDNDDYEIPVLRYELEEDLKSDQDLMGKTILVYIHGGGLLVGEADSEDLTCRRLVNSFASSAAPTIPSAQGPQKGARQDVKLYSIGYRLMPQVPASTCVSDVLSAFEAIRDLHEHGKFILVGSSSGGELAALLSQTLLPGSLHGLVLRCPVTTDAPSHMPAQFKEWHTSASPRFTTSLLGLFTREQPRDGLERMPLEMPVEKIRTLNLPRTWIQVCSNDVLYSDGICYAKLLHDSGVEVKVDVVEGWPHTFWLKAPHLERALLADEEMLKGLAWILG